jgi:hypothetical protein
MEDFLGLVIGLSAVALVKALVDRVRPHTARRVDMWFDKVTRRAYGEPPGVPPPPPPRPPNLFVAAFVNLLWLLAIFIMIAWATGLSLRGTQAVNQSAPSAKMVIIRLGLVMLLIAVAGWATRTLARRFRPRSGGDDSSTM